MATKPIKLRRGLCCAVATCINYASKLKLDGNYVFYLQIILFYYKINLDRFNR